MKRNDVWGKGRDGEGRGEGIDMLVGQDRLWGKGFLINEYFREFAERFSFDPILLTLSCLR